MSSNKNEGQGLTAGEMKERVTNAFDSAKEELKGNKQTPTVYDQATDKANELVDKVKEKVNPDDQKQDQGTVDQIKEKVTNAYESAKETVTSAVNSMKDKMHGEQQKGDST